MMLRFLVLQLCCLLLVCTWQSKASAGACKLTSFYEKSFDRFNIVVSPRSNSWRSYLEKREKDTTPVSLKVGPCPDNSNLMVDLAFEQVKALGPVADVLNLPRYYNNLTCSIENNSLSANLDSQLLDKRLRQKHSFLRNCVQYRLKARSKHLLSFLINNTPHRQYNLQGEEICKLDVVDERNIIVSTKDIGFCLFKTDSRTHFDLVFEVNPKCTDMSYLAQLGVEPQSFRAIWSFNQLDEFSGNSPSVQIESLASDIHISPEAKEEKFFSGLPLVSYPEKDYAQPSYLGVWSPEISLFDLKILRLKYKDKRSKSVEENSAFLFDLLVNNQCKQSCRDGACSSPCNFKTPAYAKAKLFNVKEDGRLSRLGYTWYTGGKAPAQWMGRVAGEFYRSPVLLKKSAKYKIRLEFFDQRKMYNKYQQEKLGKSFRYLDRDFELKLGSAGNGLDPLPELPELPPLEDLEELEEIDPDFTSPIIERNLGLEKQFWPPRYQYFCDILRSKDACLGLSTAKSESPFTLEVSFQVKDILERRYELENISVKRIARLKKQVDCSAFNQNTIQEASGKYSCEFKFIKPNVKCKFLNIERDGND